VTKAFEDSEQTYGYRRVHAQLARWDQQCTPELVRAIMRERGLMACQPRPWRHNLTESDASASPIPDLVGRDFTAQAPGQKLVGDITYIPTWEGWLYLATVIDCHTKAVIGWAMEITTRPRLSTRRSLWPPGIITWSPGRSFTPIGAVTTPARSSPRPWPRSGCGSRWVASGCVLIVRLSFVTRAGLTRVLIGPWSALALICRPARVMRPGGASPERAVTL
jgi:helix-turn-helix protein/integrase-like protein